MLRGVSLAPQQRLVKDPQELPTELVNSIIGVSAHAPDYGGTGNTNINGGAVGGGASLLSTSAQHAGASGSGGGGYSPSFLTRLFRWSHRRYQTNAAGQVPVFDVNGNLTTSQTGVNTFRFRSLSLFYFFRAQPWTALITYSILIYLLIVLLITVTYYVWGMYCGAGLNMVMSIYFTVVSLAANGGYLGEDEDTMTDSTHLCYRGRTAIVMVCSYVNIVFVGLVAALVVGKAEYTGKLGHRVVFSEFCTLTSIPGRVGQYRLTFRMANVDNNIPLAHGQLRVFCVTAEPLREYRLRQKQMHLLKNSAPLKTLAKTSYGSVHQLLPGGEATNSFRGASQHQQQPLTEAMLEGRRATHQKHKHQHHHTPQQANNNGTTNNNATANNSVAPASGTRRNVQEALAPPPPRSASGGEKDVQSGARTTQQTQSKRRNPHGGPRPRRPAGASGESGGRRRKGRSAATGTLPNTSVTDPAGAPGSPSATRHHRRHHHRRGRAPPESSGNDGGSRRAKRQQSRKDGGRNDDDAVDVRSNASSPPGGSSASSSRTTTPSRSSSSRSSLASGSASDSRSGSVNSTASRTSAASSASSSSSAAASSASGVQGTVKTKAEKSISTPGGRALGAQPAATAPNPSSPSPAAAAVAAATGAASDVTNSSMTSKVNSDLYAASPLGGLAGSFALNKRNLSPASYAAAAAVQQQQQQAAAVRVQDDNNDERELERVHLRVQEMRWTCAEETYIDRGDNGQLSLWYPATITHTIDERSPLYSFMQLPYVAASLKEGPSTMFGSARSDDSSVHPPSLGANTPDAKRHRFQLVAVFDATEMESGSTITAKHTYTTVDIVAHYKFSDRLVHMQPESGEVMLDFHYFNALLPVDLIELSTTDSEM